MVKPATQNSYAQMTINPFESTPLTKPFFPHLQVGKDVDSDHSEQFLPNIYNCVQPSILVAEREKLLGSFAQEIRHLDLDKILNRTVTQVRQFLHCDRVLIYRFQIDWSGEIVVESVVKSSRSVLGINIKDPCFKEQHIERYKRGHIQVVDDIFAAGLQPCHVALLASFQVRANLVVPMFSEQNLWGLLIAHHCQEIRKWLPTEIDLLRQLATQVGIAIQQAELLTQVKCINAHLECQLQKRTVELQKALKFEALVRLITEKIRDSLDESQVLQTATQELAQLLKVERCKIELYNACQTVGTIVYEYTTTLPRCLGLTRLVANFPEYHSLLQKQPLQYGDIVPAWNPRLRQVSRLVYPIFDNQGVLGNIWLTKPPEQVFDEFETRLVQQVANECAIAIRSARLYQASQAQVRELEKLERLKNEFLRTISHELRTPITSISLAVETLETLLKQEGLLDKQSKFGQLLQILHCQCQREKKLINDLLTLSALEAETEPLILGIIDLKTWIPPIIESFRERTNSQQQQLSLTITTDIPPLQTNISDLKRILIELLNNACKYTPPGELITVSARNRVDAVLLCVSNSGVEIPTDEMSRIFEPFYRIPKNDPWKYSGTGLGLALVRKLVRNLGGAICVDSAAGSTTFTLQFNRQNHSTLTKNLGYQPRLCRRNQKINDQ